MATRLVRLVALAALASLSACATGERVSAAGDVRSLLVAIRDNDRATFDDHVDRVALESEMQWIVVQRAKASGLGSAGTALGVLASGPLSRAAATIVLRPDVFRAIAEYYGYRPDRPLPGTLALAAALTPVDDGKVCARDARTKACLLTFSDEGGVWKLTGFDARRIGLATSGY
ncbi:MAG TPA: hypothetical protein VGH03_08385 [Caulobacteraceae bacterium]|jgi:hypothetical protein